MPAPCPDKASVGLIVPVVHVWLLPWPDPSPRPRRPPGMVVATVALMAAPLFNWWAIIHRGWGLAGAALATNLCQLTQALLLLAYCAAREAALRGTSKQTIEGVGLKALSG